MQKSNLDFHMLYYLITLLLKHLTKIMECTPKLVTEVSHREMRSVNLKFNTKKQFKQMFKVLSLVANTRLQPWVPLIDGLGDAVLQFSPNGDEVLH